MHKRLDIENWNRKEHFHFFSKMDYPFYDIVAHVDCTKAYAFCKENSISFSQYYHYQAIRAVNKIEALRMRIKGDDVIVYDTIHLGTTISREDNTFGFIYVPFSDQQDVFFEGMKAEIERVQNATGMAITEEMSRDDMIYFSAVPCISFTAITHSHSMNTGDSVPRISFGKFMKEGEKLRMPVSVTVHHGLVDGYHVGQFYKVFEELLNQ